MTKTKFGGAKLKLKLAKYRYYWACSPRGILENMRGDLVCRY